jgi:gliding motility-associated-like protein
LGYYSLQWFVSGDSAGTNETEEVELYNYPPGQYPVCLLVTSQNGCLDSLCLFVTVTDILNLHIPNAFTPDNDGTNEAFGPVLDNPDLLDYYEFRILDRWGVEVFSSDNPSERWNGSLRGSDHFVQSDTYVYLLKYREKGTSDILEKTGTVLIMR